AADGKNSLQIRSALMARGIEPIEYVPNNGFLVRVADPAKASALSDKSMFQFASEYSRSDKIDPRTGRGALRDPDRAVSDVYNVVIQVMPGESVDEVAETVRHAGGDITQVHRDVAGMDFISAKVANRNLMEVLDDPGVKGLYEQPQYTVMNL